MIEKQINKMKRKKAGDRLGWKSERIKEGGKKWEKGFLSCLIKQKRKESNQSSGSSRLQYQKGRKGTKIN